MVFNKTSWDDFYQQARDLHQLELQPIKRGMDNRALNFKELENQYSECRELLIHNLIYVGDLIVITAAAKTGKSYFTLDMLMAMASRGKITDEIFATQSSKIILIDTEMYPEDLKRRISQFSSIHNEDDNWKNNFLILSSKVDQRSYDLSNVDDQQYIESQIGDAKVVAFDNYGKLSGRNRDSEQTWNKVSKWFEKLQLRGITIILVHHLNKNGEVRGTKKMIDDATLHVSLSRPQEYTSHDGNVIEVRFPDIRNFDGADVKAFTVTYAENNGVFQKHIAEIGYMERDLVQDISPKVSDEEITEYNLSELHIEIVSVARGKREVRFRDLKNQGASGRSRSSIEKAFKYLCNKKLLEARGGTKGRYYVPLF